MLPDLDLLSQVVDGRCVFRVTGVAIVFAEEQRTYQQIRLRSRML